MVFGLRRLLAFVGFVGSFVMGGSLQEQPELAVGTSTGVDPSDGEPWSRWLAGLRRARDPALANVGSTTGHTKGFRLPGEDCHAGALCVGPHAVYPLGRRPGVKFVGEFVVPPLPEVFDRIEQTYYDYLNIFWRNPVRPGYMNQFVPQLMLGNALAGSTDDYKPEWIALDRWHVGAQYFMGICPTTNSTAAEDEDDCSKDWIPRAATGKLVPVEPGEGIRTTLELVDATGHHRADVSSRRWEWHLSIGVIGDEDRTSRVVVDRPFMGLVYNDDDDDDSSPSSWDDEAYEEIYVGSCLENYGMERPETYPSYWRIDVSVEVPPEPSSGALRAAADPPGFWRSWSLEHAKTCPWQPDSVVDSEVRGTIPGGEDHHHHHNGATTIQTATWKAWLEMPPPVPTTTQVSETRS